MTAARLAGWALIVLALILAGMIANDEIAGETNIPRGRSATIYPERRLKKAEDPGQFRNLITYKWIRALACVGGGLVLLAIARRADRLDPFSPDFSGNTALEEWGDSLRKKEANASKGRPKSGEKERD
jgi:hypothetical protein